jgi:hypothetical protein
MISMAVGRMDYRLWRRMRHLVLPAACHHPTHSTHVDTCSCITPQPYPTPTNRPTNRPGYPPFYSDDPLTTCRKIVNWRLFLKFPEEATVSPACKDLIQRLMCDVDDRLGTQGVGVSGGAAGGGLGLQGDCDLGWRGLGGGVSVWGCYSLCSANQSWTPTPCPYKPSSHILIATTTNRNRHRQDIKAHPFFSGIQWEALYAARAPYIPRVDHELDTQVGWGGGGWGGLWLFCWW